MVLSLHIEIFHTWPFSCPESDCRTTYSFEDGLKKHISSMHANPVSSPHFICPAPDCSLVFQRKVNLRRHLEYQHHSSYPLFEPSYLDLQSLHVLADSAVSSSTPITHVPFSTEMGLLSTFPTSRLRFSSIALTQWTDDQLQESQSWSRIIDLGSCF